MFRLIKLYPRQNFNPEKTLAQLVEFGYEPAEKIFQKGEFSRRGSIIDVYAVNYDSPLRVETEFDKINRIFTYNVLTGKIIYEQNPAVILPRRTTLAAFKSQRFAVDKFHELEKGDFVVHVEHGIGRYLGITKLKNKLHIVIEYAGGDKLYAPLNQKNLIQKYIGFSGHAPRLHKLGGKLWASTKSKAKKGVAGFALDLIRMQARRASLSGFAFGKDTDWQKQFEDSFPYTETADQAKAARDVKQDMESSKPMDRLLCGDVGYGKTEVAFRAAFKAVINNKQAGMLVPTTILAEQHYHNFADRVKEFPVNVRMLSRFCRAAEQEQIIKGLREGTVDIVIGTHRLLSEDISFKNLGLVIIDEEQRFGVKAKEKLKHLRELVDVLTLTATPIPRTLYMSLAGIKDMSTISTPPDKRLPIQTFTGVYDDELVKQAIANELERGGQVFFIHNRIENIAEICARLKKILPQARIAIGHGRMHERDLEKVMIDFIERKIDILVSTTIVESGLDIPNANTLIVNNAEQFGLADLYQLRGRVGRFDRQAYAYFLTPKHAVFNPDARRRLKSIQKFTELGAGFKVAMEDLEIRGAGNLLGEEQHGYIMAVGFDFYCRLLTQAVAALKKPTTP